jgi:membrane protease YdiL (CAAX protease family)
MSQNNPDQFLMTVISVGVLFLIARLVSVFGAKHPLLPAHCPPRTNSLTPLHVGGVYLLWMLAGAGATIGFLWLFTGSVDTDALQELATPESVHALLSGQLVGQVAWFLAMGYMVKHCFNHGLRGVGLSARHGIADSLRSLTGTLEVLPICIGLGLLMLQILPDGYTKTPRLLELLPSLSAGWQVAVIVSTVVLAPLCEELFFRGLLQSMIRRWASPAVAIGISSVLFGIVHTGDQPQNTPALIVLGIALGIAYERSGRLWTSIGIHALFNACFVGLTLWAGSS